jgi:hypothetical protein
MPALVLVLPPNDPCDLHYPTRLLARHFVSLQCEVLAPSETEAARWCFCGCIAEFAGSWVVVTAGQCLEASDQGLQAGYRFSNWVFDNRIGLDAGHRSLPSQFRWVWV